jgi:hypothetical protein
MTRFNIRDVVTERNKASGSKGAAALRRTSVIARLGSTQPMVRAESERLLSIFSSPQPEQSLACRTSLLLRGLWLLRRRKRTSGILWRCVLHLRRVGKFTIFSDLVAQVRRFPIGVVGGRTGVVRSRRFLVRFILAARGGGGGLVLRLLSLFLRRLSTTFAMCLLFPFPIAAID